MIAQRPASRPGLLEDIHAAFVAGYETGKAEQVDLEVEDQVLARLHARSLEALGLARRLAAVKGPSWAAMFDGGEDDEC